MLELFKTAMTEALNALQFNIPTHVCIIPDGNRRWAREKSLPTLIGHKKGVENAEALIKYAKSIGIKYLTGWGFSTENWKRKEEEISYLFGLIDVFFNKFYKMAIEENIRLVHLGRKDRLPAQVLNIITKMEEDTKNATSLTVCIALDYGGHDELLRALNKIQSNHLEITDENIEANLDTAGIPNPDLVIRTSGEQRISGFMTWQSSYSEFAFPQEYFPDFTPEVFERVLKEFSQRERRFGGDATVTTSVKTATI